MSQIKQRYLEWRENSRVFFYYLKKYRKFYAIGIGSLVVVDGLEVAPPLILKWAIDSITAGDANLVHILGRASLLYLIVAAIQSYMRFLWRKYIVQTSMLASNDMRIELFSHLTDLPPLFYRKKRVGDLVSLASNDIEAVRFGLGPGALTLFDALFYFIAIPPLMFWISPKLTLLSFLPLVVVPFFVRRMEKKIQTHFREVQEQFSHLASRCQESLSGIRIIKASAIEPFKDKEFAQLGEDYKKANLRSVRTQATLTAGLETIMALSSALLFLVGGIFVIQGQITLGMFVAFQRYIQKMAWPMEAFGLAANIFQRSIASQKRIDEVMLVEKGIIAPKVKESLTHNVPAIKVNNMTFTFGGASSPSLKNISLNIPAGTKVGLFGGVGSGKSTLLSLLARLENPPAGTLFVEGKDFQHIEITDWRKKIAYVPQEGFLFSRTIRENILYGCTDQDSLNGLAIAKRAAKLACVHKEIERLPNGYETLLGERGVNLSGGQKQRLTIARAIARAPQILLLDDCLSAVDAETEHKLLNGILEASEGITLILASHRMSTLSKMDWLIHLENGELIKQGPIEVWTEDMALQEAKHRENQERWSLLK